MLRVENDHGSTATGTAFSGEIVREGKSAFSAVRLRAKFTQGADSPTVALSMVLAIVESARPHGQRDTRSTRFAALARGTFEKRGVFVERAEAEAA
ncbi:hypothetical protein GTY65_00365 [Streptomyces sp. SID8379]|uniref:hypothetical protein n=1 Tax=unclassified Streptomyces TaxID=2593676 RepID=UPI00037062F8|nr:MULTISPECIES: hypothetical protein [unclassified Streptomyces]MYW62541.1 hypothetical protein [Streptomyces sp. SID8379]